MAEGTTAQARPATSSKKINEYLAAVSILAILWCLFCTLLEVQTTELPVLRGGGVHELIVPNLVTFMQIADLIQGRLTPVQFWAVIWGWGVQVIYNMCVLAWKHYHKAIANHNEKLAVVCVCIAIGISLYNGISNFNYASLIINDFWLCLVSACVVSLSSSTLGIAGVHCLKVALGKE